MSECPCDSWEVQADGSGICNDCGEEVGGAGSNEPPPDGTATVTITFKYPIALIQYPDEVTTVAQAVEFDAGEMAGDPQDWLMIGMNVDGEWADLSISYSVDVKSAQGGFPV